MALKHPPLISIIVPCYNQSQYLSDALMSVSHQTLSNWECIIVNDGSPDETEEVALRWVTMDSRFTYFKKENGGLSSARNFGIKAAQSPYILPLDADDKIHPAYLEKAISVFEKNEKTSVVYCQAEFFGEETGLWNLPSYNYGDLLLYNMIFCTAVFKRSDWERVNGYDESMKVGLEDWDFWIRLLANDSEVVQLPEVLFYYRRKEGSMISSLKEKLDQEVRWYVFEKNISLFRANFKPPTEAYRNELYLKQFEVAYYSIDGPWASKVRKRFVSILNFFKIKKWVKKIVSH